MPETWSMFLPALIAGWVLLLFGAHGGGWVLEILGIAVLVVAALILNFFRDFERRPDPGSQTQRGFEPGGWQGGGFGEGEGKVLPEKNLGPYRHLHESIE